MRDFIVFLVVLTVVFFGVGEWRGWYLGVPSQTPILVYKKDHTAQATRRTINIQSLPLDLSGRVRAGSVRVEVFYQRPESFQGGSGAGDRRRVFQQEYRRGQRIAIRESIESGIGIYEVILTFQDATGLFQLRLPASAQL